MEPRVVADGVPFGEGPVWCGDGTIVVTSVAAGALYRVWPDAGRTEVFADTGGGANAAAACTDGGFLVTQNGGIDFSTSGVYEEWPYRPVTPGLQRVAPDGSVAYLAAEDLRAPNDLVVAPDGTVYFTDPPRFPPPPEPVGRVMAYGRDGSTRTVADGFAYCNGIALEPEGTLVVVEDQGLQRVGFDGTREWIVERLGPGGGDGFCVDADGRFYVAATVDHGVRVIERDGREIEFLAIPGRGVTTNCCFGGADMRTLFATDAVPGTVVAWDDLPTPGLEIHAWPGP